MFVNNDSSAEYDPRTKPSHKLKMQRFANATGKSISHQNLRRVPFIPSQSSAEMTKGSGKPAANHTKKLLRANSDQGYDPLTYAEKSHFKRLLLPTRSDSVDEVFLNISAEDDHITYQEVYINDVTNFTSHRPLCERIGQKKLNGTPPRMSSFEGREPRETAEETSLLGSLTSTATQLLRAISRQSSLEIEKPTSKHEVKGKGLEMSTFSKSLIFYEPNVNAHSDKDDYLNCNGCKSVPNCYSQGDARNCAIDIFPKTNITRQASVNNDMAPLSNGYSSEAEEKPDDIQQTKPYKSNASFHLKLLPTVQPVIGINSVTAQGETYHKSRPLRHLPHMGVSQERDSSVDSVSSSDDSLTAYPVQMKNSNQSFDLQSAEQTDSFLVHTLPDSPSVKHSGTQNGSKYNKEGQSSISSERDLGYNSTASIGVPASTPHSTECNGCVSVMPLTTDTATINEHEKMTQEQNPEESNCRHALEDKPLHDTAQNGNCQDQSLTSTKDTGNCTQNDLLPEDKPLHKDPKTHPVPSSKEDPSLYLRYYHVFREGELVDLIEQHVESLHILRNYYDHANWCVIAEKVQVWTI